eukprot:jgi/Botrbrau1/1006/Bobra.114_1s0044.1
MLSASCRLRPPPCPSIIVFAPPCTKALCAGRTSCFDAGLIHLLSRPEPPKAATDQSPQQHPVTSNKAPLEQRRRAPMTAIGLPSLPHVKPHRGAPPTGKPARAPQKRQRRSGSADSDDDLPLAELVRSQPAATKKRLKSDMPLPRQSPEKPQPEPQSKSPASVPALRKQKGAGALPLPLQKQEASAPSSGSRPTRGKTPVLPVTLQLGGQLTVTLDEVPRAVAPLAVPAPEGTRTREQDADAINLVSDALPGGLEPGVVPVGTGDRVPRVSGSGAVSAVNGGLPADAVYGAGSAPVQETAAQREAAAGVPVYINRTSMPARVGRLDGRYYPPPNERISWQGDLGEMEAPVEKFVEEAIGKKLSRKKARYEILLTGDSFDRTLRDYLFEQCCICELPTDAESLLICSNDVCQFGYHMYCLDPPLSSLPDEDVDWFCPHCEQGLSPRRWQSPE